MHITTGASFPKKEAAGAGFQAMSCKFSAATPRKFRRIGQHPHPSKALAGTGSSSRTTFLLSQAQVAKGVPCQLILPPTAPLPSPMPAKLASFLGYCYKQSWVGKPMTNQPFPHLCLVTVIWACARVVLIRAFLAPPLKLTHLPSLREENQRYEYEAKMVECC